MKKYLMTGVAALAFAATFTSCSSHDGFEYNAEQENVDAAQAYQKAFTERFGTIAPGHTWGFESAKAGTRANAGETYPATSGHINANANEWAASTTGDNPKEFGGWVVPDALTPEQKARVEAYFKANPNLTYEDPEYRHFFVQQVYKGTNEIVAAGGSKYNSDNMGALYVGPNADEEFKINNFTKGDATERDDVLNNGADVNSNDKHSDKIMLMVNIDNTETFTYFNSATSSAYNNKCALVSAAVIDEWAEKQSPVPGAAVTDKWNRSFLGFDLALMEGEQCYDTSAGNASYNNAAEQPNYAWDGEKIVDISSDKTIKDKNGNPIGYIFNSPNWYQKGDADDFATGISQTQNVSGPSAIGENQIIKAIVLKEFTVDGTKYQGVVNLPLIKKLVDEGYLPVNQFGLTNWVKVAKSDGYFDDWIVTLSKAERQGEKKTVAEEGRIICEDLGTSDDFDFNDIVFDATIYTDGTCDITILAAGGTLDITVAGEDIHSHTGKMTTKCNYALPTKTGYKHLIDIPIVVSTTNSAGEITSYELHCQAGAAPQKICVPKTYKWCTERTHVDDAYPGFKEWVKANNGMSWTENPVAGKVVE